MQNAQIDDAGCRALVGAMGLIICECQTVLSVFAAETQRSILLPRVHSCIDLKMYKIQALREIGGDVPRSFAGSVISVESSTPWAELTYTENLSS